MTQTQEGKQTFTVILPMSLYKRLRHQKAEENRSMVAIVTEAVLNYLDLYSPNGKHR